MAGTRVRAGTDTGQDARRIARRVNGDLIAMIEDLDVSSATNIDALVHDLQIFIANDCVNTLTVFLYAKGAGRDEAGRAYRYRRVARGSFEESPHSGRILRDSTFAGGRIEFEVDPRDTVTINFLKTACKLQINWTTCKGRSVAGMTVRDDGGYGSGTIAVSRTCMTRRK